jgi:putative ABC transport system permease protein
MDTLRKDVWFALRGLARSPGFVAVIVATLGLGIGVNVAMFTVVDGMLLEALPYRDAERVVRIWDAKPSQGWNQSSISPLNFRDWQERSRTFSDLAIFQGRSYNLSDEGEPERIQGTAASANLFRLLGRSPALGRDFRPEEDAPGAAPVVMISDRLWQRRFAGNPAVVGSTLKLDGVAHTVVGVMPPRFFFPEPDHDAWVPTAFPTDPEMRGNRSYAAVGRLGDGVTLDQAHADLVRVAADLEREFPDDNAGWTTRIEPAIQDLLGEEVPKFFLLLMLAVGFVVLIACANIASLLLSRAVTRMREISVRTVLGATRWRLLRQLLTEAVVLAIGGGAVGILTAFPMVRLLLLTAPPDAPRIDNVAIDGNVLLYAAAITLATALLFGLIPALQASKPDLHASLKDGARGSGSAPRHRMLRGLVAAEVALATSLLALGLLSVRSLQDLLRQDPGFDTSDLLTFQLNLPETKYPDDASKRLFFDRLMGELRALPGVATVSAVQTLPLSGSNSWRGVTVEGIPLEEPSRRQSVGYMQIEDQYFEALDIPLLRGRALGATDLAEGATAIVVNQSFAKRYWPNGEDPIGRRLRYGWEPIKDQETPWLTIVGVVGDVRHSGLGDPPRPEIYVPYANRPNRAMTVVLETARKVGDQATGAARSTPAADPTAIATLARDTVRKIDPDQPVWNVRTVDQILRRESSGFRAIAEILGALAFGALGLAAVGIYGVITWSVSQRRHEIGIRRAVGAGARDILWLTLRQGLSPVAIGLGIGSRCRSASASRCAACCSGSCRPRRRPTWWRRPDCSRWRRRRAWCRRRARRGSTRWWCCGTNRRSRRLRSGSAGTPRSRRRRIACSPGPRRQP